jgi:prevent-host-death family protein
MSTFTLVEAKAQLSRLIRMVGAGDEITITKRVAGLSDPGGRQ